MSAFYKKTALRRKVRLGYAIFMTVWYNIYTLITNFAALSQNNNFKMGVTELKRKGRRNKAVANNRTAKIKDLLRKPEVRNVDVEAIKAQFEANKK